MSRTQKAIAWILATQASQGEAAEKFGISQCTVSLGLKAHFKKRPGTTPDARHRARRRAHEEEEITMGKKKAPAPAAKPKPKQKK